jgi:hypothetical protein
MFSEDRIPSSVQTSENTFIHKVRSTCGSGPHKNDLHIVLEQHLTGSQY